MWQPMVVEHRWSDVEVSGPSDVSERWQYCIFLPPGRGIEACGTGHWRRKKLQRKLELTSSGITGVSMVDHTHRIIMTWDRIRPFHDRHLLCLIHGRVPSE